MSDIYIYLNEYIYIYNCIYRKGRCGGLSLWCFEEASKNIFGLYHQMLIVLIIFVAERKRVQGKIDIRISKSENGGVLQYFP
jgi:hypothetical protein